MGELVKRIWKSAAVLGGTLVALVGSGSVAAAESGYGAPWNNCVNSVVMGRGGGQVWAYGILKCPGARDYLNPDVALSGNNGAHGFEEALGACRNATYCETPKVYLPEVAGVTYKGSNSGTFSGIFAGPPDSVAHAQLTGGTQPSRAGTEAGSGRVRWADFDGDGRSDYVIVNSNGSVRVYLNRGGDGHGGWVDHGQVATGLTTDLSRVRFADFNGDRKADYIFINGNGSIGVFLNKGGDGRGGWQDIGQVAGGTTTDQNQVRFADIDGDGHTDYNVISSSGAIYTYVNRGGDKSGGWEYYGQIATGLTADRSRVRLADFDGYGKADYNLINANGSINTYVNAGGDGRGGWENYGQVASGLTTDQNAVVLADITGDGRVDYLVTSADGSVRAYRNDGGDGYGGWTDYGKIATGA
jgi:hypothetical protein